MLVEIHEEQEEIDEEYDDEIWFDDMDQKIFSFKHKAHNWLKEGEKSRKSESQNLVQNIVQNLVQNRVLHQNQGRLQRQKQLRRN